MAERTSNNINTNTNMNNNMNTNTNTNTNTDTNIMDRVRAHFDAKETKIIEVPEWGDAGNPLYIYSSPLTLAQKNKLYKMAKDDDLGLMVEAVIMKAKDKTGEPLFSKADKPELMRGCDPEVLIRVASSIMETSGNGSGDSDGYSCGNGSNNNLDEIKKNS